MYLDYANFSKAYGFAEQYNNINNYIDSCVKDSIVLEEPVLREIFRIQKLDMLSLRQELGISRAEMHRRYKIPLRTLEDWEAGRYQVSQYVKILVAYTVVCYLINKK